MRTGYKKIPLFSQNSAVTGQERSGGWFEGEWDRRSVWKLLPQDSGGDTPPDRPPLNQACRSLPAPGRKTNFLSVIINHGETQASREISHIWRQMTQLFPRLILCVTPLTQL